MEEENVKYLVSVIIPTYNRAHLITDAIDSVLSQTYKNFELLVVDDHSTDNTKEVVETYSDSRIKYLINTRKKGAQGARNTGLYTANGEWVAMLDSDDVWLPEKLEKQVDYLKQIGEDVAGISCGFAFYDFDNQKILRERIPAKNTFSEYDLLYKNYIGGFSVFLFKREYGLEVGGFDERLFCMQDADFYIELTSLRSIVAMDEVLVYVREDNKDRISYNFSNRIDSVRIFTDKHLQSIQKDKYLRNRAMNRFFLYHTLNGDWEAFKYIHWYILGLFIDSANYFEVSELIARTAISKLVTSIRKLF